MTVVLCLELQANNVVDTPALQCKVETASDVIEHQGLLASKFRKLMTDGQTFQRSNQYREAFYKEVIGKVADVSSRPVDNFSVQCE